MVAVMLDVPAQPSLFGAGDPVFDPHDLGARRELADDAWVVHMPAWLTGEQTLFDHLVATTDWQAQRRPMFDRVVDVPRLTASIPRHGPGHPVLDRIAIHLGDRFGEPMPKIGLALYRNGADSVAPHGDQVTGNLYTTTMATLSLGARRRFLLTPVSGGGSLTFELGHGDLLVMGGTIQRTWRHGIPKTNRAVGPRICVMFRGAGLD